MTRVLFLQRQPCIRTLKYAAALRSTGHPFQLGFAYEGQALSQWYGTGDDLFDHWWSLGPDPAADLTRILRSYRPDVIHSHNLPDRLTVVVIELVDGSVPVIHDVHDLQSLRQTPYEDGFPEPVDPLLLEKHAIDQADAVVAVSPEMLDEIISRYGKPRRALCFANFALGRDLPAVLPSPERRHGGPPRVVYQGTVSTNGGHYDLRQIFTTLVAQGVLLDIYPARPAPEYHELAADMPHMTAHDMLPPQRLMEVLPQYDYGWAGFNAALNRPHLDTALPNKAFDYIGCGLPVLTLGHRALERFVRQEGIGLSLTTLDDLAGQLGQVDIVDLRRRVAAARERFTVEANIGQITRLYDELVDGA